MSIYEDLGVRRVVNAYGTVTPYGGVLLAPQVRQAMAEAAESFVEVSELSARAGQEMARLLGYSDGIVTAGAAAGLTLAAAAAIAGPDDRSPASLPRDPGERCEILVHRCQRNHWTQAVELAGARVVEFGTQEATRVGDLTEALSPRTAAVLYYIDHEPELSLGLETVGELARAADVPVIVDAAALFPFPEGAASYDDHGATVTLLSGGKLLGGPASTGLALGESAMLEAMRRHASPHFAVGRPMKVGKEDIAGLLRAVQLAVAPGAAPAREQAWERRARRITDGLRVPAGVRARYVPVGEDVVLPRVVPRVYLEWEPADLGVDAATVAERLLEGDPRIAVGAWGHRIGLNPAVLADDEVELLVSRVNDVLEEVAGRG